MEQQQDGSESKTSKTRTKSDIDKHFPPELEFKGSMMESIWEGHHLCDWPVVRGTGLVIGVFRAVREYLESTEKNRRNQKRL